MFGWMERAVLGDPSGDERDTALDGMLITSAAGLVGGMKVATDHGWREADMLRIGDRVLTFDHGFQSLREIQRDRLVPSGNGMPDATRPVAVPAGAIGNAARFFLMPDQGLLVESDTVNDILDDPFAVVPARALAGNLGITFEEPGDELTINTLAFEHDEVIYIEGGLLAHCPRPRDILGADMSVGRSLYTVLRPRAARHLVQCLVDDGHSDALVCDHDELEEVTARTRQHLRVVLD